MDHMRPVPPAAVKIQERIIFSILSLSLEVLRIPYAQPKKDCPKEDCVDTEASHFVKEFLKGIGVLLLKYLSSDRL